MAENEGTLRRFYRAFAARDAETMAACYAEDATFQDPVFSLSGSDIGDMWRMLIERGRDLRVEPRILDGSHAEWTAHYTFQGRPVHNEIRSEFEVDPRGRIARQVDRFDFPRWARQALGWKGRLFGRFGFMRSAVSKASTKSLASWQRHRAEPASNR